ncbi:MAG: hypothetical protein LBT66_09125 [Methanobrevibacter sp.]|jgi:hypothetical protein|nr:hypothetical protein [Candidatus Methanovirga meridionalis]
MKKLFSIFLICVLAAGLATNVSAVSAATGTAGLTAISNQLSLIYDSTPVDVLVAGEYVPSAGNELLWLSAINAIRNAGYTYTIVESPITVYSGSVADGVQFTAQGYIDVLLGENGSNFVHFNPYRASKSLIQKVAAPNDWQRLYA